MEQAKWSAAGVDLAHVEEAAAGSWPADAAAVGFAFVAQPAHGGGE